MPRIRDRIENAFASSGRFICRHPWWFIFATLLLVGGLSAGASRLVMDTSPEGMLHEGDPVRADYDAFRRQFEGDAAIVVGIRAPAVFDAAFVGRLEALHRDLESDVPHLSEITSLVNARYTRGEEAGFVVGDLLPDWIALGRDAGALQRFAVSHPLYRDNFLSSSGQLAAIVLRTRGTVTDALPIGDDPLAAFDAVRVGGEEVYFSQRERAEVVDAVRTVLARHEAPDFHTVLSGSPVIVDAFDRTTQSDSALCVSLSTLGILLVLWLFFRRVSGVILPNLVSNGAIAATLGLMGWTGAPFTLSSPGIFAVLIAMGTCSSIHLLTIFYRRLEEGQERHEAVSGALGHAGPAIVMTGLTTAAGLFSFATAPLASTANMGLFSAAGVMVALPLTLVLLPAVIAVVPIRADVRNPVRSGWLDRHLERLAVLTTWRYREILAAAVVVAVVGLVGADRVRFSHDPVSYFDRGAAVRADLETIDHELGGGTTLEVLIDSGRDNGLYDPGLLAEIDALSRELSDTRGPLGDVRVFSVNDIVKETNQALHANDPARYEIPPDRPTLSQELFLFEQSGSHDLGRMVDSRNRTARLSIKTPYADGVLYRDFVEGVRRIFEERLAGRAEVTVTGAMALEARAVPYALETMAQSYVVAFLVISAMMVAFLGSLKIGLVAMVPNLLPIVAVMGLMGFTGMPVDQTTITLGSIGLGLVVDDTIHFLYNFQKYREATGSVTRGVCESFLGVGRAMIVTSGVLVACFWVDLFAELSNVNRFGFLVGLIVVVALVTDFLVGPALMQWLERGDGDSLRRAAPPRARAAAVGVLLLLVAAFATLPAAAASADDARAIMERVHERDDGDHVVMEIHMTLVDREGHRRERRARSYGRDREDGGTDSVLFFLEPADVRDTGFLTHDHPDPDRADDQWLFLPAMGRTKRISTSEKSRPFMGSDFSYADMTKRSPDRYDYTLVKEVDVEGQPAWQIEAVPRSDAEREETGYARSIVFVRKDIDLVVRAIHWIDGSDEMKLLDVKELAVVDGIWTPIEVHMSRVRGRQVQHQTILRATHVDYERQLAARMFTTRRLEKGP